MNAKVSSLLFFALTLFFTSANAAIDITQILSANPDFSQFSSFLTQTKVAEQINSRQIITVLVVDNGAMSSIAEKPQDVLKKILSVHVVLDYYDMEKVTKISLTNRSGPSLTTLFQASGQALKQQGFLTVFLLNEGEVTFGSSVQGAPMNSMLVKSVSNQPNIISVLQISQPIEVPGIETPNPNAPKDNKAKSEAPQHASAPTQAQSPSRKIGAPTPGTDEKAQAQTSKDSAAASAPTQEESATAPTSNKDSAAPAPNQKDSAADAPTPTQEDSPAAAPSDSKAATPSESPVESPTPAATTVATSTPVNAQASPAEAPSNDSAPSQKAVAIGSGVVMSLVYFLGFLS